MRHPEHDHRSPAPKGVDEGGDPQVSRVMYPPSTEAATSAGESDDSSDVLARPAQANHIVQFYEDEDFLCDAVAQFLAAGLKAGEPVCVVAGASHRDEIAARLARRGLFVEEARARGQLIWLDARETLSKFMVGDMPDWELFRSVVGGAIDQSRKRTPYACVRAYGEMVDLLWRSGNKQAALSLETMWNDLASTHQLSLLCAYVMGNFYRTGDAESFRDVCRAHSHVLPAEQRPEHGPAELHDEADARRREISELQQRARALENEVEQRKELEAALRQALIREKEAREEAERSVRYNEMFAGMLGHDLRNPLSAITTGANYIARLNSSEKSTRAATRILASAERMGRMIDQLLDFTRIRVGGGLALNRTRFDLEEVCCKVRDELEAAHPDRSIVVEATGNVAGEWDHDRLLQVFSNLISNALHHGAGNGVVTVRCDGDGRDGVKVTVHNEGVVPADVLPVLFEPFRGNTRYQRTRGLGLGLFITQQIVAAHGGTIDVSSGPGAGTVFQIYLPRPTSSPKPDPLTSSALH
jgi:signal transduction histidine kinase